MSRGVPRLVRFSAEEDATVRARAALAHRTVARYVREAALGVTPVVPAGAMNRLDAEVITQLARVGNNLNQLAREANGAERLADARRIDAALAELETLFTRFS